MLVADRLTRGGRLTLPRRAKEALAGLVQLMSHSAPRLAAVLATSVAVQIVTATVVFVLARASGVDILFWQCAALTLPVLMVSALPLSIAGWGLREGGFALAFAFLGVPASQSITVSIVYGLAILTVALPGGVVFALTRASAGAGPASEEPAR